MQKQFYSAREIATYFGIGLSTVWKYAQNGHFPKPIKLSTKCTRWNINDFNGIDLAVNR